MNDIRNENSGTNTILIVLVLVAVVAFGIWFFGQRGATPPLEGEDGVNIDVDVPMPGEPGNPPGGTGGTGTDGAGTGGTGGYTQ